MPKPKKKKKITLTGALPVLFLCITLVVAGAAVYLRFIKTDSVLAVSAPVSSVPGSAVSAGDVSDLSLSVSSVLSSSEPDSSDAPESASSAVSSDVLPSSQESESASSAAESQNPDSSVPDSTSSGGDQTGTDDPSPSTVVEKYSAPTEMRAVVLTAGQDYLTEEGMTDEQVCAEIDEALQSIVNLEMNTVIIDTQYDGKVIYPSDNLPSMAESMDYLGYIISKAKESNLYVYATYPVLDVDEDGTIAVPSVIDADTLDLCNRNIRELASYYEVNGILFTDYYNPQSSTSYSTYSAVGSAVGFENYMYETSKLIIRTAANAIESTNSAIQVGLLADTVWANSSENGEGSETSADFQMYYDGYSDVKTYMEDGYVDFVAVKALGSTTDTEVPFGKVVSWWANLAETTDTSLYTIQATDWAYPDELGKQLLEARTYLGYKGSVYNSLTTMITNVECTDCLIKAYNGELDVEGLNQELGMISPTSTNYTTYDDKVAFSGVSDPNFKVTLNGQEITSNDKGYFSLMADLEPGNNTFVFANKGRSVTYKIYRKIKVLNSVDPTGTMTVDGETKIAVSAVAYKGSSVYAVINGTTVPMVEVESQDESTDKNSSYTRFEGVYTAPKSTKAVQNLGAIVVYGTCYGQSESLAGATIKVNKILDLSDTRQVTLTASITETFPYNTSTDLANPVTYPLPKGTTDFVVGDKITVVENGETFYYYKLKSGKRVYVADCQLVAQGSFKNNNINGVDVEVDNSYTYLKFDMDWNVPYSMELSPVSYNSKSSTDYSVTNYGATTFSVSFDYTGSISSLPDLSQSPLFSSVSTSQTSSGDVDRTVLSFKLSEAGTYRGCFAYYDSDGYLVLRFNNPTGIKGAKIYLDAGHGGADVGATGYGGITEDTLNYKLTAKVKSILESYGATVYTHAEPSSGKLVMADRIQQAYQDCAQAYVSIHHNWSYDSSVQGIETFYYTSFSMPLARDIASRLASCYANDIYGNGSSKYNRGAKFSRYYVTRVFEFPSVLIECGFMSNPDEMMYLTDDQKTDKLAEAIAAGIWDYFEN